MIFKNTWSAQISPFKSLCRHHRDKKKASCCCLLRVSPEKLSWYVFYDVIKPKGKKQAIIPMLSHVLSFDGDAREA